jgi:lipopolysaccharide export system permease protein
VWLTAGLSPAAWIRPVLTFAVPLVALVAAVSLFLAPWAKGKGNQYANLLKQREEISALAPGVFKETQGGKRVYFIENYSGEAGAANNIFVQLIDSEGRLSSVFAQSGRLYTDDTHGERFLLLEHGRRYEGEAGRQDFRVVEFQRYRVRIDQGLKPLSESSSKIRPTVELMTEGDQGSRGELAWRFSVPISALILALLAIPLSHYNPRAGQTLNLLVALFIYMFYYNTMGVVESAISRGKVGWLTGMLPLHLSLFILFVGLMAWRSGALRRNKGVC